MNQASKGGTVPCTVEDCTLYNRENRSFAFSVVRLLLIAVIGGFALIALALSSVDPRGKYHHIAPEVIAETRLDFFINSMNDMFASVTPGTDVELGLGRQSNRVVLTGAVDQINLPDATKGADQICIDYFDGNIVACHLADDRELSRLYLVDQVKSLVWEAYFAETGEWMPIYVAGHDSKKPTKIRLVYQLEIGKDQVVEFPVAHPDIVKVAATGPAGF